MWGLDPAWIALIGTIVATVGVKLLERWLGTKDRNTADAAQIRSELKVQLQDARNEINDLEREIDQWRVKYYEVLEQLVAKKIELQNALNEIKLLTSATQQSVHEVQRIIDNQIPRHTDSKDY